MGQQVECGGTLEGDSEAVLCRVLDSMANGVIAIDREGTIFVFNASAARLP